MKNMSEFSIKAKKFLLGSKEKSGFIKNFLLYLVLITIGFVYIYPMLYMIATSVMSTEDLVDSTVSWIPTHLSFGSFVKAAKTLGFWEGLLTSVKMTLAPAILQTVVLAMAGYGLARFPIPFKKGIIAIAIVLFLIPVQVTLIPRYLMFNAYKLTNTILPIYIISGLGQGVRSSIFLLVFYQFFSTIPKSLDEAAQIDGANPWKVFVKIAIPMAMPAIIVTFLFSFIWIWNETAQMIQLCGTSANTLPMRLATFVDSFNKLFPSNEGAYGGALNESIRLAGTLLSIAPLLLIYIILQRKFIESVEKTGITGE